MVFYLKWVGNVLVQLIVKLLQYFAALCEDDVALHVASGYILGITVLIVNLKAYQSPWQVFISIIQAGEYFWCYSSYKVTVTLYEYEYAVTERSAIVSVSTSVLT